VAGDDFEQPMTSPAATPQDKPRIQLSVMLVAEARLAPG